MARPLDELPKAHLHLHLTGAMRHSTLVELARAHRVHLPVALTEEWPPKLSGADERGWFRFQRLYDTARSVLRTPADLQRLFREIAEDERAEGSRWLEIQVDPSGYAGRFGGLTPTVELVLDAAAGGAPRRTGVGIGIVIAANRTRHPLDARTLARLAVQYAGRGRDRFRAQQRRAARPGGRLRAGLPDRRTRRPAGGAARRGAGRPGERAGLPGRAARGPDRARRAGRTRPRTGQAAGQPGRDAGGVPVVQCGAGHRRAQPRRAAAAAVRGRASRSRSAPTTRCCSARGWSPSTGSRGASTASPTPSWPTWPGCRCWARPRRTRCGLDLLAGIDAWLAAA